MSAKNFYNFVIRHNDIHKRIYISNRSLISTDVLYNDAAQERLYKNITLFISILL